jgi:hypothetical protein
MSYSEYMFSKLHKISLLLLGITALVSSRALFLFFNDPEGPNLLIVIGMALILYSLSFVVYVFSSSLTEFKRLMLAISLQILLVIGLHFFLN